MSESQRFVTSFDSVRAQIIEVEKQTSQKSEKEKRKLWAQLDEIDEYIQKHEDKFPKDFVKVRINSL